MVQACFSASAADARARAPACNDPCPSLSCAPRWEWWNLWFELALLLALFITCFMAEAFKRGRMAFLAFFVLATQGLMWSAHEFLTQVQLGPVDVKDLGQDAVNAGAFGTPNWWRAQRAHHSTQRTAHCCSAQHAPRAVLQAPAQLA